MNRRQRAVALIVVLWVLAVLSTLLAGVVAWVQLESRQASWQQQHTQAILAAEAGLNLAVAAIKGSALTREWLPDGRPHVMHFNDTQLNVSVRNEKGKLDLNFASARDIARLLEACDASSASAQRYAGMLIKRREQGAALIRTLDEAQDLLGLPLVVYQRAVPYITVWSGEPRPEPSLAAPLLARALKLPKYPNTERDFNSALTVESEVTLPTGYTATLRVTLLLTATREGGRPYRVLRWQE